MKKSSNFNMLVAFFLLLAIHACNSGTPTNLMTEPETLTPVPTVYRISSQIAASSIQELAYYSDIIVVGQIVSKEKIINTARDPSDPTQPDPRFFSINQVYKVEAERVLKGEAIKPLLVLQNQGLLATTSSTRPNSVEIESEINRNEQKTFLPLSLNTRYIFFLRVLDKTGYDLDGYKSTGLYAGAAEPWRFRITTDEFVIPETLLPDINLCFPQMTLDDVKTIIEVASDAYIPGNNNSCSKPYPPPSTNSPESPYRLTPYP